MKEDRVKQLEEEVKALEFHRQKMRKVFWSGVDASAKSWLKERKLRLKAERERDALQRRLNLLMIKPRRK